MATADQELNCSITKHFKPGVMRVLVQIPELKTTGFIHKKVDERSMRLDVQFVGEEKLQVRARVLTGTNAGTQYFLELDKDDLYDCRPVKHPKYPYTVANGELHIFIKMP